MEDRENVEESKQNVSKVHKYTVYIVIVLALILVSLSLYIIVNLTNLHWSNVQITPNEIVVLNTQLFSELRHIILHSRHSLRSPRGIAQLAREVHYVVHQSTSYYYLFTTYLSVVYLFLQSLCLPGTIVLNVIAGTLYGVLNGVVLCTLLGTLGAVSCYTISYCLGVRVVDWLDRKLLNGNGVETLRNKICQYRSELFVYLLFLRLTPLLPNWLINLASPILHVPLYTFVSATALGILPQTYLAVRFGAVLEPQSTIHNQINDNNYYNSNNITNTISNSTLGASSNVELTSSSIVKLSDTLLLAVLASTVLLVSRLRKRYTTNRAHQHE